MKKDNIEDVYNELGKFSKEPPKELWDNIEARLHPKKKRRGILFFWSTAAAVLVLFIGYTIFNSPNPNLLPIKEITDIEQNKVDDNINESEIKTTKIVDEVSVNNSTEDSLSEKRNTKEELLNNVASENQLSVRNPLKKKRSEAEYSNMPANEKTINDKKENFKYNKSYAQNIKEEQKDEVIDKDISILKKEHMSHVNQAKENVLVNNDSISKVKGNMLLDLSEELLAENEEVNDSINPNTLTHLKWSVEVLGGLANTASDASIQGTSVNTTSKNDFVYTLKLGYAITDRLVVKSGVGKNILGQEINNISYISSEASLSAGNSQNIVSNQAIIFLASEESINDFSISGEATNKGDLKQQFDYIQVPLEVSYNVLRAQKFDVSIGVGGNVNFLTNNRAFLDDEEIGESIGANTTIFGATINSNMSFQLAKKTILFLEPSYNYYEKPIDNNNQTFNNTQLRVLFGLRYKF